MPATTPPIVTYLRSLEAVRDRSQKVFDLAQKGQLDHWDWHGERLGDVVQFCADIIAVGGEGGVCVG
jgi:hypothetical protein